ncbi:MAG: DUF2442 domain-containing protein [Bacteroidales bacterium]|nr:DUF2442 domain-containing protein [Bacteroidales bacterium]
MQTILENNTNAISASVLMINNQGVMISVEGNDYFLSYNRVPWMKDATVRNILNIKMSGKNAIEWPDLDIDLEIDSLKHPERYPLVMNRNEFDYIQ